MFYYLLCTALNNLLGKGLAILDLLEAVLLQADGLDGNEARGVHGGEALKRVHRSILLRVEVAGIRLAAKDVGSALVNRHADLTSNVLLGVDEGVLKELTLGREVHAVVEAVRPLNRDELVTELANLGVHDKTLKIQVSKAARILSVHDRVSIGFCRNIRNGKTGGVVAASALETDETVLNNIDSANTVVVANLVQKLEQSNRVGNLTLGGDNLGGDTLLEVDGEVVGNIGSVGRVDGAGPELLGGRVVGVLKDTSLVRAVHEVVIHGPGSLGAGGDGNVVLGGELEEIGTALELLDELGHSPGGDDLHLGVASLEGKLEADLVILDLGISITLLGIFE